MYKNIKSQAKFWYSLHIIKKMIVALFPHIYINFLSNKVFDNRINLNIVFIKSLQLCIL